MSDYMLSPVDMAFLFIPPEEIRIKPTQQQADIHHQSKVVCSSGENVFIGQALWQGDNTACWVVECTNNGTEWMTKICKTAQMMPLTTLQYATFIGTAKQINGVPETARNLLKEQTLICQIENELGTYKNGCPVCSIPLVLRIKREVVMDAAVVDKTKKAMLQVSEAETIQDTVEECYLWCYGCETRTEVDWADVEIGAEKEER